MHLWKFNKIHLNYCSYTKTWRVKGVGGGGGRGNSGDSEGSLKAGQKTLCPKQMPNVLYNNRNFLKVAAWRVFHAV